MRIFVIEAVSEYRHKSFLYIPEPTGFTLSRELYANLEVSNGRGCLSEQKDNFDISALNVSLLHLYSREPFRLRGLIRNILAPYATAPESQ